MSDDICVWCGAWAIRAQSGEITEWAVDMSMDHLGHEHEVLETQSNRGTES